MIPIRQYSPSSDVLMTVGNVTEGTIKQDRKVGTDVISHTTGVEYPQIRTHPNVGLTVQCRAGSFGVHHVIAITVIALCFQMCYWKASDI